MVNQVENWYTNIPIITRCILTLSCVLSVLVTLDVISPLHLYLNYRQVWYPKYQVWRLFTHFFFFDRLSINFVLHMYFVYFYCTRLESHTFHRRSADFLWMILFGMLGMTLLSPLLSSLFSLVHHTLYHIIYPTLHSLYTHLTVLAMSSLSSGSGGSGSNYGNGGNGSGGGSESMGGSHHNGDGNITKTNNVVVISLPFMSHSLVIMMLYVWSRFNPHERLRLYGLFTISASYLSYVMLVLGMVMGMSPLNDMNGILIGHLYYFLNHVLPMEYPHVTTMVNNNGGNGNNGNGAGIGGGGVIRAPQFLCKLLNPPTASSSTAVADDVIVINDDDEQQQEQEQPVVQDEREDGDAHNNNHHGAPPPRLFMDNGDDDDDDNGDHIDEDEDNNDGNPLLTTRQRNVQQQQEHLANGE